MCVCHTLLYEWADGSTAEHKEEEEDEIKEYCWKPAATFVGIGEGCDDRSQFSYKCPQCGRMETRHCG